MSDSQKPQLRETDKDLRDTIRTAIFASSNFQTRKIRLFDQEVEVRQPSIAQLMDLTDSGSESTKSAAVNAMIEFCVLPGTETKVFTKEDYDNLLDLPMGDWFIQFQKVWSELASIDVGEAEGN